MHCQIPFLCKAFITLLALIRLQFCVDNLVPFQIYLFGKELFALVTLIWLLNLVDGLASCHSVLWCNTPAHKLITQGISLSDGTGLYVRMAVIEKLRTLFNSHTPYSDNFYF